MAALKKTTKDLAEKEVAENPAPLTEEERAYKLIKAVVVCINQYGEFIRLRIHEDPRCMQAFGSVDTAAIALEVMVGGQVRYEVKCKMVSAEMPRRMRYALEDELQYVSYADVRDIQSDEIFYAIVAGVCVNIMKFFGRVSQGVALCNTVRTYSHKKKKAINKADGKAARELLKRVK